MNFLVSLVVAAALTAQAAPQRPSPTPSPSPSPSPSAPAATLPEPPPSPFATGAQQQAGSPAPNRDPGGARYTIGPNDLLKITVFDEAELTNTYRVDSDGFVTFPLLGRVQAGGLTPGEFQDRLREQLSNGYIRNPQVRVEIDQYKSQSVYVSGEVRTPGKITMSGAMTLLEALAAAGSPTSAASSELTIAHQRKAGTSDADAEKDLVRVNWRELQLGKVTDVGLQDGDIINVPKAQTFYITGQVRNSGSFVLEPGMTIEQAIVIAGGLTDRGSDRGITVSRTVNGKRVEIQVKLTDKVQANDTITIRQRFF